MLFSGLFRDIFVLVSKSVDIIWLNPSSLVVGACFWIGFDGICLSEFKIESLGVLALLLVCDRSRLTKCNLCRGLNVYPDSDKFS